MANILPRGIILNTGQEKVSQQGDALVSTDGNLISAFTGVPGFTGFFGFTGLQSPLSGITGFNVTGDTGLTGETGIASTQGSTGFQGVSGLAGYTGGDSVGETGIRGFTGIPGATGITGDYGSYGLQGVTGLIGATGISITGFIGITGLGIAGFTGVSGSTGSLGDTGLLGITGSGIYGETGIRGVTGTIGITGITDINSIFNDTQTSGFTMIYPLSIGFLGVNNQSLAFKATLTTATDGSPTSITLQFGGVTIFTDTFASAGGAYGFIEGLILRESVSAQRTVVSAIYSNNTCMASRAVTSANLAAVQEIIVSVSSGGIGHQVNNIIVSKLFQP